MENPALDPTLAVAIRENFTRVQEQIASAAQRSGRALASVGLVVVTKAQPVEVIRAAVAAGARLLGENYPDETAQKLPLLGQLPALQWHMIGHLQSRKLPLVVEHFSMLHSLDRFSLAEKLERKLAEAGRDLPVLLEMNVGGEDSKFGWNASDEALWPNLLQEVEQIAQMPHLRLRGLMTMPPYEEDPDRARVYFTRLRRLGEFLSARVGAQYFSELSMGTSADYIPAVEEGATLVRVGQAILGPRPPKQV